MPLKLCACGCGRSFVGRRSRRFVERSHYTRSPKAKADALRASHVAKARRDAKKASMALSGFSRMTAREYEIYQRGRKNGWSSGYDMGRRKGFADACHENEPQRMRVA